MSRHKLFQPPEKCILSRHIGEAQIDLQHLLIELLHKSRLLHDLADHRTVEQLPVCSLVIVERLGAEMVSQTEELLLPVIPQRKRKHTVHMVSHLISPCLIGSDQDLLLALFP